MRQGLQGRGLGLHQQLGTGSHTVQGHQGVGIRQTGVGQGKVRILGDGAVKVGDCLGIFCDTSPVPGIAATEVIVVGFGFCRLLVRETRPLLAVQVDLDLVGDGGSDVALHIENVFHL